MKLTRKLIPAFAMLLLSAVLLSTASFAWFTSNATVTANGMKVQATTAANLLISKDDGASYDVAVNFNESTATTLTPCSTNATVGSKVVANSVFADNKFYALNNAEGIDYNSGAASDTTEFKLATNGDDVNYFKKYTFTVKYDAAAGITAKDLYLKTLTVTSPATVGVSKALRVAIVATNGSDVYSYLFAPHGGTYLDSKSVAGLKTVTFDDQSTNEKAADLQTQAMTDMTTINSGNVTFGDLVSLTGAVNFTVYVWYEGNDTNCTSVKATATEALSIEFTFEYKNVVTPSQGESDE